MRSIWILGVATALISGPAFAQGLIPPSRQYTPFTPEKLDKTYGLPTFGTQAEAMPKQQTMTPKPQQDERPDAFKPMPNFAGSEAKPTDETPDFFQKQAGLASAPNSDVPNFFQDTTDDARPKARSSDDGDTPLFTTGTMGDTTSGGAAQPADKPNN